MQQVLKQAFLKRVEGILVAPSCEVDGQAPDVEN